MACISPAIAQETWWRPTADRPLSFHWMLYDPLDLDNPVHMGVRDFSGRSLPEPDVYDIDGEINPKNTIDALHAKSKKVICYIDVGAYETYRGDAWKFQQLSPQIWGKSDGWAGSYWLDIRRVAELEPIMKARMQMCKDKGFDAIEPDQMDAWENSLDPGTGLPNAATGRTGFAITYEDQLRYNQALARWAHEIGMSIGQKGDIAQSVDLVTHFDWVLNEECHAYSECLNPYDPSSDLQVPGLQVYTQSNKAAFVAEYKSYSTNKWESICQFSRVHRLNTVGFKLDLDGARQPCSTSTLW